MNSQSGCTHTACGLLVRSSRASLRLAWSSQCVCPRCASPRCAAAHCAMPVPKAFQRFELNFDAKGQDLFPLSVVLPYLQDNQEGRQPPPTRPLAQMLRPLVGRPCVMRARAARTCAWTPREMDCPPLTINGAVWAQATIVCSEPRCSSPRPRRGLLEADGPQFSTRSHRRQRASASALLAALRPQGLQPAPA